MVDREFAQTHVRSNIVILMFDKLQRATAPCGIKSGCVCNTSSHLHARTLRRVSHCRVASRASTSNSNTEIRLSSNQLKINTGVLKLHLKKMHFNDQSQCARHTSTSDVELSHQAVISTFILSRHSIEEALRIYSVRRINTYKITYKLVYINIFAVHIAVGISHSQCLYATNGTIMQKRANIQLGSEKNTLILRKMSTNTPFFSKNDAVIVQLGRHY